MTVELMCRLLLGHVVGDYLLQTNQMALNKKESTLWAALHSFIWTCCIILAMAPEWNAFSNTQCWIVGSAIFLSHFVLDRFAVVDWWFRYIGSRSYRACIDYCNSDQDTIKKQFMVAYTALVQTVADNGLHLLFLYIIVKYLIDFSAGL